MSHVDEEEYIYLMLTRDQPNRIIACHTVSFFVSLINDVDATGSYDVIQSNIKPQVGNKDQDDYTPRFVPPPKPVAFIIRNQCMDDRSAKHQEINPLF